MSPAKSELDLGGCPVNHADYRLDAAAGEHFLLIDADREAARVWWNDSTEHGFWMLNRYDDVLEACQTPETFSNAQINAFDPTLPPRVILPNQLDQPEHVKLRKILNPFFSPAAVQRILPKAQERATALVLQTKPAGNCEFVTDFAIQYPTELFLELMGLPIEDGADFIAWNEAIFRGFFDTSDEARRENDAALASILAYFEQRVQERSQDLRDPELDIISRLLRAEIDGVPIPRGEVLTICFTLNLAGLDTTRSGLGYIHHFLATHPDVRAQLVAEPDQWPKAIEEFIRMSGLIIASGRVVTRDVEFHGAPMKAGDAVWMGFAGAGRDPRKFDHPSDFDMDRPNLNQHFGFGAGPHRCIGMHLARAEMAIALRTWHEHIPDYWVDTDDPIMERGGQLSLKRLPLAWTA